MLCGVFSSNNFLSKTSSIIRKSSYLNETQGQVFAFPSTFCKLHQGDHRVSIKSQKLIAVESVESLKMEQRTQLVVLALGVAQKSTTFEALNTREKLCAMTNFVPVQNKTYHNGQWFLAKELLHWSWKMWKLCVVIIFSNVRGKLQLSGNKKGSIFTSKNYSCSISLS